MPSSTKMPTNVSMLFLPIDLPRRARFLRDVYVPRPPPLRRREHERGQNEVGHQHAERSDDDRARRSVSDSLGRRLRLVALVEGDERADEAEDDALDDAVAD